jgi:hypothetical protein
MLPSGSAKKDMWQTPVSKVSPMKLTPRSSSVARGRRHVLDVQRQVVGVRPELADAHALRVDHAERDRAGLEFREVPLRLVHASVQPERRAVELDCALQVLGGHGDEVNSGDDRGGLGGAHAPKIGRTPHEAAPGRA